MTPRNPLDAELIVSYLTLRKAVGYIGLLMPILVRVGACYFEQIPSNTSISAYYYTSMRDVFVGALAAIGVFLFCYRGPDTQDNVLTNIAGACAIAIGLLPTEPEYHPLILAKFPNILTDECYQKPWPTRLSHILCRRVLFDHQLPDDLSLHETQSTTHHEAKGNTKQDLHRVRHRDGHLHRPGRNHKIKGLLQFDILAGNGGDSGIQYCLANKGPRDPEGQR